MAVSFGFSVSDFIAGIILLKNSIEAIRNKKGARADYQGLITELSSLQAGLTAIEGLQLGTTRPTNYTAIEEAVTGCQRCVDDFLRRIAKYQPSLSGGGNSSGWKAKAPQIQWALCKKDDVASFRTQLERHSSSINMLFLTFQM